MAFLILSMPAKLMTNEGRMHRVPEEVLEQVEPDEQFESALRYARKAGLIHQDEYEQSTNLIRAA